MSIFDQKVIKYEMKPLSSLEKVFPDETPVYRMECQMLSGLWHNTVTCKDTKMILIEDSNTSMDNSDILDLNEDQIAAIKALV